MQDPRLKVKPNTRERKQIKEMTQFRMPEEACRWAIEQPPERYDNSRRLSHEFRPPPFHKSPWHSTWQLYEMYSALGSPLFKFT